MKTNRPHALVTGASSGIGLEMCRNLARRGYDLSIVARQAPALNNLKQELENQFSIQVHVLPVDLSRDNAATEVVSKLGSEAVDVLINNAGLGQFGSFVESDWNKHQTMLRVNIEALTHLTYLLLPGMLKRGKGHILNVASTAGFFPGPLMAVYFASKAYVLSFSQALANEVDGSGVSVTTLCPGPTETNFEKTASLQDSKLFKRTSLATAKDVADYGIKAMLCKETVAIHGAGNKALVLSSNLVPRQLLTRLVRMIQERVD